MTDLLKLAERVEAGETSVVLQYALTREFGNESDLIESAINGSLDAAKTLHDAVLPGWIYTINWYRPTMKLSAEVYVAETGGTEKDFRGASETPAAAWVAAILRAKHAEGER